jgi:hypothetical protein
MRSKIFPFLHKPCEIDRIPEMGRLRNVLRSRAAGGIESGALTRRGNDQQIGRRIDVDADAAQIVARRERRHPLSVYADSCKLSSHIDDKESDF